MKTGIELIAEERQRQIHREGYDERHDDAHKNGELTDAAGCYATVASAQTCGATAKEFPVTLFYGYDGFTWPWRDEEWKPSDDVIKNLVRAGALIAAEIDRIQRLK